MTFFKKITVAVLILAVVTSVCPMVFAESISARPALTTIVIDEKTEKLQAYEINGYNYYKLRDLAMLFDGTDNGFSVNWDGETNTVLIKTGENYVPVGGEYCISENTEPVETCATDSVIVFDGENLGLKAYMINNCNYFKLRDVMQLLDVSVEWNESAQTIVIDTSRNYSMPWKTVAGTKLLTTEQVAEKAESVVLLKTYDEDGEEHGMASGFFITADGWLATCYHAIESCYKAEVTCDDGTVYPVTEVLAYNKDYDTAIVQVSADREFVPLEFAKSEELKRGQRVMAIGSPQGEQNTVSDGLVSAVNRDAKGLRCKEAHDIQVSVPISRGSSGGPLLDMYGNVVGISYATHNYGQNMNYAIKTEEFFGLFDNISRMSVQEFYELTAIKEIVDEASDVSYIF